MTEKNDQRKIVRAKNNMRPKAVADTTRRSASSVRHAPVETWIGTCIIVFFVIAALWIGFNLFVAR